MKKEYEKPELIEVSLVTEEDITTNTDWVDGEMGLESSIFG